MLKKTLLRKSYSYWLSPANLEQFLLRNQYQRGQIVLRGVFLKWLSIITRRVWIGRLEYHERRSAISEPFPRPARDEENARDVADPRLNPEDLAALREELQAVCDKLATAKPTHRDYLLMILEGWPVSAIANATGMTPEHVSQALSRLRARLRHARDSGPHDAPQPGTVEASHSKTSPHEAIPRTKPPRRKRSVPS